ncbi:MAG: hypothetical protein KKD59_09160 [Acidobacteria bacterium]|nr:hypothetical protein [Acidobacteriota bacterium]
MNKSSGKGLPVTVGVCGAALFILGFSLFARSGLMVDVAQEESKAKGLLRLDLLAKEPRPLQLSARNIFSPRSTVRDRNPDVNPAEAAIRRGEEGREAGASADSPSISQNIRYIGYVFSEGNRVAVIVYQGETLAVREGEGIDDRYRLTSVSRTEIRLAGPDEQTTVFPLEGEQK